MPYTAHAKIEIHTAYARWQAPARAFHWLIAGSMAGAAILTSHGEIGHTTFGWMALGAVLIWQLGLRTNTPSPTLWLVTAVLVALNLSGVFAPHSNVHLGTTLAVLVLAALYLATVLFESVQRIVACDGQSKRGFRATVKPTV
jgi:cytochrome b